MITNPEEDEHRRYSEAIRRAEETLRLLQAADRGLKLWRVPIVFDDYHKGDEIKSSKIVWAKDVDHAIRLATINVHGIQWCYVNREDDEVTLIMDVPRFNQKTWKRISPKTIPSNIYIPKVEY